MDGMGIMDGGEAEAESADWLADVAYALIASCELRLADAAR